MGPVWAEATGVKSVFSSLSSMAGPCTAGPSSRPHQPCVRAQRESERHLSAAVLAPYCVVLPMGLGSIWNHPKETACDNHTTIRPVQTCQHSLLGTQSNFSSLVKTEKDKKIPAYMHRWEHHTAASWIWTGTATALGRSLWLLITVGTNCQPGACFDGDREQHSKQSREHNPHWPQLTP